MNQSTSTTSLTTALKICEEWRDKLPDGSRMNKAQLFNLLAPQIAMAIDDAAISLQSQLEQLRAERDRLMRGDFTDEELQGFCHNLSEQDRDAFFEGCTKYQERLFGTSAIAQTATLMRDKCVSVVTAMHDAERAQHDDPKTPIPSRMRHRFRMLFALDIVAALNSLTLDTEDLK